MADLVDKPFSEIIGRRCWEVVHGTTAAIDNCPMVRTAGGPIDRIRGGGRRDLV